MRGKKASPRGKKHSLKRPSHRKRWRPACGNSRPKAPPNESPVSSLLKKVSGTLRVEGSRHLFQQAARVARFQSAIPSVKEPWHRSQTMEIDLVRRATLSST